MNARSALRCSRVCALLACLCAASAAHAAHATLTPEGPVTLIRATTVYRVNAPVALEPGDLLATGPQAGAQIQYDDGTLAALAADTRLAVDATASTDSLALLSGWTKVTRTHALPSSALSIDTTAWRAMLSDGSAVVHADAVSVSLFVESGSIVLTVTGRGERPQPVSGERYVQRAPSDAGKPLATQPRPAPEFIAAMPAPFRDPLGPIVRRTAAKDDALADGRTASYADIGDWLTASLPLRRTFAARFRPLAQARPFRAQVQQHLRDLPDWRRVLCPPPAPPRARIHAPIEAISEEPS
ncbi:FecR domain-containing protein [Caballeronia sp. GAFFF1]|uniref:FecR domain-containing protein n=1 Tax=Caballeronia sp. GAFFF1 TaxID=2921779 RepID=UPI002027F539|nr:FecR domain-containing protein [Caballeronia sp. GAFFF1]